MDAPNDFVGASREFMIGRDFENPDPFSAAPRTIPADSTALKIAEVLYSNLGVPMLMRNICNEVKTDKNVGLNYLEAVQANMPDVLIYELDNKEKRRHGFTRKDKAIVAMPKEEWGRPV